ncbi:DNA polymerase beta superfamily protein [Pedobacter gandavensis]|uniref:nucleotidyltransferase domain-containing protein n=1 Tax=Pedobacter gandavensis TaxID=2679963 RepID=UPI00292DF0B8|nr:nucleotidyltransferase domain-containing protein [Pedobacter gandavensis]
MTIKEIKDRGLLLFECISGSRAYGLATLKSDTDLKGVFYLPRSEYYGLNYIPQVSNESNDEVYYELGRFVDLLIKSNPNILEMLASPADCILYKHPLMERLNIKMFLSKSCKETFSGYAITQVRKAKGLKKKIVNPMPQKRAAVLDFCYMLEGYTSVSLKSWLAQRNYSQERCGLVNIPHVKGLFALFYDAEGKFNYKGIAVNETANEVSLSSVPKEEQEMGYLSFNAESYSMYCKEFREYWDWVDKRNEDRYMDNKQHGKDYDAKNMMHTIRLLQVTEELFKTGELRVNRPNREDLLAIRSGKFEYTALLAQAEALIQKIDVAYEQTTLPETLDHQKLENILIEIRNELY